MVIDGESITRLAKANAAFGRLHKNVWSRRGISTKTKVQVHRASVLTTLFYGCETWTVYQRHARKLNHIHTCLRFLGIKWQDKIPSTASHSCWPAQHQHHPHAVSAALDRKCSSHARRSTSKETDVWRASARKTPS